MRIKAVSEYKLVYASNEFEIPAMKIEQDGTCSMIYASTQGCSHEMHNRVVIVIHFSNYSTHGCFDGPILYLRTFQRCVKQNKELIKKILEGWGSPYWNFQGNYVCDLTDEANLALQQLDYRVNYFYKGVCPEVPSFLLNYNKT